MPNHFDHAPGRPGSAVSRRSVLSGLALGVTTLGAQSVLAACGGEPTPKKSAGAVKLTWSLSSLQGLDLGGALSSNTAQASFLVLEGLVGYDSNLQLRPVLAKSWRQASPTEYVYEIRENITFSDGSALTAADVVATLRRHVDPKSGSQLNYYFDKVASVTETGPMQVTVKLKAPNAFFKYDAAIAGIMPRAFVAKHGRNIGSPGALLIGTGPYVVSDFAPGDHATFRRNPGYWGERPASEQVTLKVIANNDTQLLAARGKQIDAAVDYPMDSAPRWDHVPGFETTYAPSLGVMYLSFGLAGKPWNDIHVRRAFAHALDRENLVKALLRGRGSAARTLVSPDQWRSIASPDAVRQMYASLPDHAFDLEAAKRELAQSSVPKGFTATVRYGDDETEGKVLQSLAENLKPLGVNLELKEITPSQATDEIFANKGTGLQIIKMVPSYPDPGDVPFQIFPSAGAVPNALNTAHWKNKTADALCDGYSKATSDAQRMEIMRKLLQLVGEEIPYVPIWWPHTGLALRKGLRFDHFNGLWYCGPVGAAVRGA